MAWAGRPPDTEHSGRALPMLLGQLNPLKKGKLDFHNRRLENLTIDAVRRSISNNEYAKAEIEVCLVWLHRLLGANPCSPVDQKIANLTPTPTLDLSPNPKPNRNPNP